MKYLALVFVVMALYGLFTNHYGGALMSAGMAVFVVWASRSYERQDQAYLRDPRNAKAPPETEQMLDKHDCEGS